jgi:CheY-like chemotaxis protein
MLSATEANLTVVSNGQLALDAVQKVDFDLILMDIQMPQMDGLEATTTIRQYEKENSLLPVPIIALSAYVQEKEVRESKVVGCNQHIAKPVQREVLTSIVISSINQYKQAAKK